MYRYERLTFTTKESAESGPDFSVTKLKAFKTATPASSKPDTDESGFTAMMTPRRTGIWLAWCNFIIPRNKSSTFCFEGSPTTTWNKPNQLNIKIALLSDVLFFHQLMRGVDFYYLSFKTDFFFTFKSRIPKVDVNRLQFKQLMIGFQSHPYVSMCSARTPNFHFMPPKKKRVRTIHGPKPALDPKNYRSPHYYLGVLRLNYLCLTNVFMLKYQHKKKYKTWIKKACKRKHLLSITR